MCTLCRNKQVVNGAILTLTSVLFSVWFNNFALTTGFNWLFLKLLVLMCSCQWPTCMIRSRDTAEGQAPWNCHRKCMESADSTVQRQL